MSKVAFSVSAAEGKMEQLFWDVLRIETPVVIVGRSERVFATRDELKDVLRGVLESDVDEFDIVDVWLRRVYCGRDLLGKGVVSQDDVLESYLDRVERKYKVWVSETYLNKLAVPDTEEYVYYGFDVEKELMKKEAEAVFVNYVREMRSEVEEIMDRLDDGVR